MEKLLKAYFESKGFVDLELGNFCTTQHAGETVYCVKVMGKDTIFVRTRDLLVFLFERQA